jgi:hypothetical protein
MRDYQKKADHIGKGNKEPGTQATETGNPDTAGRAHLAKNREPALNDARPSYMTGPRQATVVETYAVDGESSAHGVRTSRQITPRAPMGVGAYTAKKGA